VRGAGVRGAGFLSESLANYSAMMVTEKTYGPEAARRVYEFQMERYFRGRAEQSREVPVLEVEDQPYIAYRRGAIALYTLRELSSRCSLARPCCYDMPRGWVSRRAPGSRINSVLSASGQ
jgi:hypothetical protein